MQQILPTVSLGMARLWIALTNIGQVHHDEADVAETQRERTSATIILDKVIHSTVITIHTSANHDQRDTSSNTPNDTNLNMSFIRGARAGNIDQRHGTPRNHLNDAHQRRRQDRVAIQEKQRACTRNPSSPNASNLVIECDEVFVAAKRYHQTSY